MLLERPVSDPYRVLGVTKKASSDEVRQAYRSLVRRFHPDTNPEAEPGPELAAIVRAYRELVRRGVVRGSEPKPQRTPPRIDVYA
jgi:curved DNA-binding protein CbpA